MNLVNNEAIVFGGSDGKSSFSDVWSLNLDSATWTQLKISNTEEEFARLSHSSTLIGQNLFIIGGHDGSVYHSDILLLNLVTLKFNRRSAGGDIPAPRGYHTANAFEGRVVLIAGFDGKEVFAEVFYLSLATFAWTVHVKNYVIGAGVGK